MHMLMARCGSDECKPPQTAWPWEVLRRTKNTCCFFEGSSTAERMWLMGSGAPPPLMLKLWLQTPQPFSRRAIAHLTHQLKLQPFSEH